MGPKNINSAMEVLVPGRAEAAAAADFFFLLPYLALTLVRR